MSQIYSFCNNVRTGIIDFGFRGTPHPHVIISEGVGEMAEIQGQFDVNLPTPIDLAPDFSLPDLEFCQFYVSASKVVIIPLKMTEVIVYPEGDYESPKLVKIKVQITRDIDLNPQKDGSLIISSAEERRFEDILVEACIRFVTIVKYKTNQWNLDTRHPLRSYTYSYSLGEAPVQPAFPLESGYERMPEYASGTISLSTSDFHDELDFVIWSQIVAEISHPQLPPFYEELLHDAKNFRSHMRYDVSVLYAAIASELMLEKICETLLGRKGELNETQIHVIMSSLRVPSLLKLIGELAPEFRDKENEIRNLFELRNKIAHGEIKEVTGGIATEALREAEQLKRQLAGFW